MAILTLQPDNSYDSRHAAPPRRSNLFRTSLFSQAIQHPDCRTSPVALTGRTRSLGPYSDTPRYSGSAGHSPPGAERRAKCRVPSGGGPRADADLTQLPSLPHIQIVSTAVRPLQETPAPGPLLGDAHPLDGLLVDLSLAAKPVRGEDDRHAASKLGIPSREQLRRELLTSRATDAS